MQQSAADHSGGQQPVHISLDEAHLGTQKTVVDRCLLPCLDCRQWLAAGPVARPCAQCAGQCVALGVRHASAQQPEPGLCPTCLGTGLEPLTCAACHGVGVIATSRELAFVVPRGSRHGDALVATVAGQDHDQDRALSWSSMMMHDRDRRSLLGNVHVAPTFNGSPEPGRAHFSGHEGRVYVVIYLTLAEALGGFDVPIVGLGGERLCLQSAPGHVYGHGEVYAVPGHGLHCKHSLGRDCLYVSVRVEMPFSADCLGRSRGRVPPSETSGTCVVLRDFVGSNVAL